METTAVTSMGSKIVSAITDGVTGLVKPLTSAFVDGFNNMFTTSTGDLTGFATFCLVLMGVGAVFGVTKLVMHFVKSH